MWEKILVVDDDVETRAKFYEILSTLGYTVTCVPTGNEALLRLTEERPALVILDRNMPALDGLETARKIREFDKDIKIIILSEEEIVQEEKSVKELNIQAIIKKDFSSPALVQKIRLALKKKEPSGPEETLLEKTKGSILTLVIDDNREIRDVLVDFLTRRGYKTLSASSGEEALMKIKIEKPQIALLDIRMPGLDGLTTLKGIKNFDDSIKVIMLTSAQDEYIMEEAKRLGASDYVIKPCDLNKLDELITSVLFQRKD
jgi:CheY-like chemotaxis protein